MDMNTILEKIRLRRRDEDRDQDADRKDLAQREDEERRAAAAEAADIEADLQKEQDEARKREDLFKDGRGFDEEERRLPDPPRRAIVRDAEMDPGWLDRWEAEGTMSPLTDEEREKLKAIDREDPMGREQREAFLPREVLAIRADSDRWVAEQAREQASEQEREPEPAPAPEQEIDDDMEMDR